VRLVDTSAWIEWFLGSPTGEKVGALLPERNDWLVPTIVQLELAKWFKREADEERAERVIAFTQKCRVVGLDTELALTAADLSAGHKLAIADAIVYATAEAHGADVLTCDAHFNGLPRAKFVGKQSTKGS
jgi:predicted nucleic acid-binding protein